MFYVHLLIFTNPNTKQLLSVLVIGEYKLCLRQSKANSRITTAYSTLAKPY